MQAVFVGSPPILLLGFRILGFIGFIGFIWFIGFREDITGIWALKPLIWVLGALGTDYSQSPKLGQCKALFLNY